MATGSPETSMPSETPKVVDMLAEAINIGSRGMMFHGKMALIAHSMGLQGQKRIHRYNAREDANYMMHIQHYAIDMHGSAISPDTAPWVIPEITDVKSYLQAYLDYELDVEAKMNNLVNRLVIAEKNGEAAQVQNIKCVQKEIEKIRRWMQSFELSGWDMAYILDLDKKLHDKYKEKEKSQGVD